MKEVFYFQNPDGQDNSHTLLLYEKFNCFVIVLYLVCPECLHDNIAHLYQCTVFLTLHCSFFFVSREMTVYLSQDVGIK